MSQSRFVVSCSAHLLLLLASFFLVPSAPSCINGRPAARGRRRLLCSIGTPDLNPDNFDVAEILWVERKWQELGKIVAVFRLIAALSFCITSVRLRTLSGLFKLVSAEFGTGGRRWTGIDATLVNFGDFAWQSCDLDSFCTPQRYLRCLVETAQ
jgi:hypothetical protein